MQNIDKNYDSNEVEALKEAGIDLESGKKTYLLTGEKEDLSEKKPEENFVFLPIKKALKKYPFIKEKYMWKLVSPDKDEYTKAVKDDMEGGYFIWLKKDHKEILPLQACFYIKEAYHKQKVHNLIILEENSELHIINGCISGTEAESAKHYGITEVYVGKKATLSYSMVHNWNESTEVYPRSAIQVEEKGKFISNYIALKQTKIVQSYPTVYLKRKAKASLNSIIFSHQGSVYDVGGRAILEEEGAKAEIMSRSVSKGGKIIARAHIFSKVDGTFGHVECSSLMLNKEGKVHAIPELESNAKDVVLSHEAMIGKIAEEEVHYLMSRGISEEEAVSLIVRGFLNIDIKDLPGIIRDQIQETINLLETNNAL